MSPTILQACREATGGSVSDDHIIAILSLLRIDPEGDLEDFHWDYRP